ncbi:MAG: GNAT family N-acetyltransferase [Spirochaetia bacterium]|nr:GNAT family N-acetyltransferase [Spirochaetia bacterium]
MMATHTLENVGIEELTRVHNLGFSDYQIDVAMSEQKLLNTLTRNGYHPESSVGLFDGDVLVGFVLNGVRGNYCYDSGTAIIPSYRGKGYAHLLLDKTLSVLKDQAIHTWVLEVLSDNTKAIKLYQGIGFTQQRSFNCYHIDANTITSKDTESGITLTPQQTISIPQGECLPSWQNDDQAIRAGGVPTWDIITEKRKIGTLCYDPVSGAIAQICMQVEKRRKGYAKQAIIEATKLCEKKQLRFINIDGSYLPLNNLLLSLGFVCFTTQLEMTNTIRGKA